MPPEPLVSALMAAYNAEPYIGEAIESALAQDWPADRLEIIVVDDGSTDATAEIAARYPVRLIRQANGGPCAAVNTALAAAHGEWLGLLDADDAWPRDKLRVQGEVLLSRPEVGLVYGDMRVVDGDGELLQESWLEGEPLIPEGRCAAEILAGNPATASSLLMRASVVEPIPLEIPYTDWWFAARAALVSELAYVPEPRTLYRFHGGNITLGVAGPNRLRELRKAMTLVRYFLRRMPDGAASARGLAAAWSFYEHCGRDILELTGSPFTRLADVTDADREQARGRAAAPPADLAAAAPGRAPATAAPVAAAAPPAALAAAGPASTAASAGLAAAARAAAADPTDEAARDSLRDALARELGGDDQRIVLAFAQELLDGGLDAWTATMGGVPRVTLAVVTPPELTDALGERVPDELDVVAIADPAQLALAHALYSATPRADPAVPRFGPESLARLAAAWDC